MTIVDALKKLYWKLGGQDKCDVSTSVDMLKKIYYKLGGTDRCDVNTSAEMVEKLADVAQAGGGGSGEGWAVHTLVDDSSVEFEGNPESPGNFDCAYPNVQLGYKDFIVVTVNGDIQASGQFIINQYGSTLPESIEVPVTGGTVSVYFGVFNSVVAFGLSYNMDNPPTQAPSISLKVERIGDSSGEQPWAEGGGGGEGGGR